MGIMSGLFGGYRSAVETYDQAFSRLSQAFHTMEQAFNTVVKQRDQLQEENLLLKKRLESK